MHLWFEDAALLPEHLYFEKWNSVPLKWKKETLLDFLFLEIFLPIKIISFIVSSIFKMDILISEFIYCYSCWKSFIKIHTQKISIFNISKRLSFQNLRKFAQIFSCLVPTLNEKFSKAPSMYDSYLFYTHNLTFQDFRLFADSF